MFTIQTNKFFLMLFFAFICVVSLIGGQAQASSNPYNGKLIVSVYVDGVWVEQGSIPYDSYISEKTLQLANVQSDKPTTLKLEKIGVGKSHLDSVFLGTLSPNEVNGDTDFKVGKLAATDQDLINVEETGMILKFPSGISSNVLKVAARIEPGEIGKSPFHFPSSNLFKEIDMNSEYYTYPMNSSRGNLVLDGQLSEVTSQAPFFKEYTIPVSGHPNGFTYGWVRNDDDNLYVAIDFTPDNTYDGDADYTKVYVKTSSGVKEFKVSVPETNWGQAFFTYTDKVAYQHKVYEYKIPFASAGITLDQLDVQLAFAAYGTASASVPSVTTSDDDTTNVGVDGRDIHVAWTLFAGIASTMAAQEIYILPAATPFSQTNLQNHTYTPIQTINNGTDRSWTGTAAITSDSAGNLLRGGNYYVYIAPVRSYNAGQPQYLNSGSYDPYGYQSILLQPEPPTLAVAAGDQEALLSWSSVTGATTYDIYRGTATNSYDATPIGTSSGTTYTATGLTNGTPYYFALKMHYNVGSTPVTSTYSNEVSVTPYVIPIATAAIAGVTAPVTGATPVTTVTETTYYTGTVVWSPTTTPFAASTVYTATITVTPKAGYTLIGVAQNFFTVAGATATNAASSGVVTAVFPVTAAVPIATTAIAGVTAPVTGATPVTTVTETTYYTGTVVWSPTTTPFAASTTYTATITVTPKAGYTLIGVAQNFFTVAGATATNAASSGVVTAVFPVTAAATPSGGGGGGGGSAITTPVTTPVTSTDGSLTLPSGRIGEVSLGNAVTISIPADATGKELKLTIEKVLDTQKLLTDKTVVASPIYEILKNFSENFSKPVTLTLAFDSAKLSGEQKAAVFYYDEAKKEWVEVPGGKVNGDNITVEVDHFTKYAVFAVDKAAVVPVVPIKPNLNFSDISGHWSEANIKQAVSSGIVTGYPDGTFKPGKTVTRAEFAVMLMNVLKPQGEGAALTFTDASKIGALAQKAVAQAIQAGIIKGYEDGTFRPDAEITRAEMAAMLANALGQSIEADAATSFADDEDIPAWAKASVAYVKQAGIVQGKGNNEFAPQDHTTRAESVTVLLKLLAQKSQ